MQSDSTTLHQQACNEVRTEEYSPTTVQPGEEVGLSAPLPADPIPSPAPSVAASQPLGVDVVMGLALRFLANYRNTQPTVRKQHNPVPPPSHSPRDSPARNGARGRVTTTQHNNDVVASHRAPCGDPRSNRPHHTASRSPLCCSSPIVATTNMMCGVHPPPAPSGRGGGRRAGATGAQPNGRTPLGSVEWGPSRRVPVPPSIVPSNTAVLAPAIRQRFALSNANRRIVPKEHSKRIADALPRAERRLLAQYEVPQWIAERIEWLLSPVASGSSASSGHGAARWDAVLRLHHLPAVSCIVMAQIALRTSLARRLVTAKRAARTARLHLHLHGPRVSGPLVATKHEELDANYPPVCPPHAASTAVTTRAKCIPAPFHRAGMTAFPALDLSNVPPRISVNAGGTTLPTTMVASNHFLPDAHLPDRRLSVGLGVTKASATYRQRKKSIQATTVDDSIIKENAAYSLHRFFVVCALKWKLRTRLKQRLEEYLSEMVLDEHVRVLHAFLELKRSSIVLAFRLRLQGRRRAASVIQRYYRAHACRQAYYWRLVDLRRRTNLRVVLDKQYDACRVLISVLQMLRARSMLAKRKKLLQMKMQYREEAEKRERAQELTLRLSSLLTSVVRRQKRSTQVALLIKKRVAKEKQDERRIRLHEAVPILQSTLLQRKSLLIRKQKQLIVVAALSAQLREKMQMVCRTINEATAKALLVRVHDVVLRFFARCPAMWKRRVRRRLVDESCGMRMKEEDSEAES